MGESEGECKDKDKIKDNKKDKDKDKRNLKIPRHALDECKAGESEGEKILATKIFASKILRLLLRPENGQSEFGLKIR